MIKGKISVFFSVCLLYAFLLNGISVQAQLRPIPLEKTAAKKPQKGYSLRIRQATDTLSLPFWDDFSFTSSSPHDSLWFRSSNVSVTNGLAIRPPSRNAATFDGVDSLGRPYSQDPNLSGESDNLISKTINLGATAVTAEEKASVYLSFYWQLQGRGERPESADSIKLFFLDSDSVWQQVWQQGGSSSLDSATFKQEIIGLAQADAVAFPNGGNQDDDRTFFHEGFRFRFAAFNRQSGLFDLWHLDYVYLDKNRNARDLYYKDYTLSEANVSLFFPYTALPIQQYFAAPEKYTLPLLEFTAYSNEEPGLPNGVRYNLSLFDASGSLITVLGDTIFEDNQGNLLTGQQHFTERLPGIRPGILQPYASQDSLYLHTVTSLYFEDDRPFFRSNDTVLVQNVLHDYFAYDDGTAEYALELGGGRGLRMAYEFELQVPDTLTHIDINIPYYLRSSGGQFVDLHVFQTLAINDGERDSTLYTFRDVSISNSEGLNQFNSYELPLPIVVPAGKFYIGIEKRSNSFLAIGFDRNTNNQDKVFVSTDQESWFSGQEDEGSIMMRPRFARVADPSIVGIRDRELSFPVNLYPNPSNGRFTAEAEQEIKSIQVYNIQGQLLRSAELSAGGNRKEIDIQGLPNGFYLVKLIFKNASTTKKIFIKN